MCHHHTTIGFGSLMNLVTVVPEVILDPSFSFCVGLLSPHSGEIGGFSVTFLHVSGSSRAWVHGRRPNENRSTIILYRFP